MKKKGCYNMPYLYKQIDISKVTSLKAERARMLAEAHRDQLEDIKNHLTRLLSISSVSPIEMSFIQNEIDKHLESVYCKLNTLHEIKIAQ